MEESHAHVGVQGRTIWNNGARACRIGIHSLDSFLAASGPDCMGIQVHALALQREVFHNLVRVAADV